MQVLLEGEAQSAGLARYFKPLQQRHSPKDACYNWGILERERYIKAYSSNHQQRFADSH